MFVRGSGSGEEYRRVDNGFYRGIVVKNNDPEKLNRVKIYIPEISNQPFDDWFEKYDSIDVKFPGLNNDTMPWVDTKIFEEMSKLIPWAEPCYPLFGESGNGRYWTDKETSLITDANYSDGFNVNDTVPPNITNGSYSPAYLYENATTAVSDAFSEPIHNCGVNCNPYSFNYKPTKYVNKAKGIFGIPEVGAKLWLFHREGDLNFPIYFGVSHDFRELTLINNTDNDNNISPSYPGSMESFKPI
jgi:hypothetical protein